MSMLPCLAFPYSFVGHIVWVHVCEITMGYAYHVASWNCFYDYKTYSSPSFPLGINSARNLNFLNLKGY
jgi:hypothetical protein